MTRSATEVGAGLAGRDRLALARVLTWIEAGDRRAATALEGVHPMADRSARVIGVTGPPGAGKSTLTSALVQLLREGGETVGVLAVDPSSPVSGGALLGDRIRMAVHTADPGVFVRSMATRGRLGGLAAAVPASLRALDAFGFDWLIVETVGVGQVEMDVAALADTTLVVVAPGWGDEVQAAKAGLLEVADILVVNKSDLPGADVTAQQLTGSAGRAREGWSPPVLRCSAHSGVGAEVVLDAVRKHRLAPVDPRADPRWRGLEQARRAVREAVDALVVRALFADTGCVLLADVAAGRLTPGAAAGALLSQMPAQR